jgi:penicillin-binding protein 1C
MHIREVKVSPDARISYCDACAPATGYITKRYPALTAELQAYYLNEGKSYDAIPPHNPACEKIFPGVGPAISSPLDGNTYYIDSKNPEAVMLKATAAADVSALYWYVDDRYYKKCKPGEKLFFMPSEGRVKISCTDDKGRNRDIYITAIHIRL